MKPEIKALWIDALRSGEYNQGKGRLYRKHGDTQEYCCLGVLCDLHRKAHKDMEWEIDGGTLHYDGSSEVLPRSVQKWAGLNEANPSIWDRSAASLNDHGTPFNTIANLIKKHL